MDEGYWTKYHPVYGRFLRSTKDYYKGISEEKKAKKAKTVVNKPAPRKKPEPKLRTKAF